MIYLYVLQTIYTLHNITFLFPTNIIGTFGQKCLTSGVHFSGIFSRESGESMEKHMSMTSVSG